MHSNETMPLDVPLDAPLDARCVYTLNVEKFQRSLDHPNIKYIYAVLLLTHNFCFLN